MELERRWGTPVDRASMGAARFATHLRYLMVRVSEDRQLTDTPMDIMGAMRLSQPSAAEAAERLGVVVGERLGRSLTAEEVAFAALDELLREAEPEEVDLLAINLDRRRVLGFGRGAPETGQ